MLACSQRYAQNVTNCAKVINSKLTPRDYYKTLFCISFNSSYLLFLSSIQTGSPCLFWGGLGCLAQSCATSTANCREHDELLIDRKEACFQLQ